MSADVHETLANLFLLSSSADDGVGTLWMVAELVRDRVEDDFCVVAVLGTCQKCPIRSSMVIPRVHLTELIRKGLLEYEGGNPRRVVHSSSRSRA